MKMKDIYARLIEDLPARSGPERGAVANARATRDFVAHLPLANPAQAAREVGAMLETMQATIWPVGERIEALEVLRATVASLCEGIEQQLGVESHPLPAAKEKLVETAHAFHCGLARNYALALHELCTPDGKLPRFKGKPAATAAVRALTHLGTMMQWSYRLYRTPPPGTWRLLHALHRFAQQVSVADRPVTDALPDGAELDATQAYSHALLLALSNPYRFSARELRDAWLLTRCFAPYCALGPAAGAAIAVDENSDNGPGYVPEERVLAEDDIFALDLAPLMRFLEDHAALRPPGADRLSFRQRGGQNVEVAITFLHRLRSSWMGAAERGFLRMGAGHALDAVIGLHAVHFVLAGNHDFGAFMQRVRGSTIALSSGESAAAWTANADASRPQVWSAQVLDQSLGGYRLQLQSGGSALRIRVGEVIGLSPAAEDGESQEWMVGLIRWLRTDETGVFAGVELLTRRARASGVQVSAGGDELRAPQRAVMMQAENGATSLLVAHLFDQRATALELTVPADPASWASRPTVREHTVTAIDEISAAYYRVSIAEPVVAQDEDFEAFMPGVAVPAR
jgi:hypothetical protein